MRKVGFQMTISDEDAVTSVTLWTFVAAIIDIPLGDGVDDLRAVARFILAASDDTLRECMS
jgi:hypothetical protein